MRVSAARAQRFVLTELALALLCRPPPHNRRKKEAQRNRTKGKQKEYSGAMQRQPHALLATTPSAAQMASAGEIGRRRDRGAEAKRLLTPPAGSDQNAQIAAQKNGPAAPLLLSTQCCR